MEMLIFLAVLLALSGPAALFFAISTRGRLSRAEARIRELEAGLIAGGAAPLPGAAPLAPERPSQPAWTAPPQPAPPPATVSTEPPPVPEPPPIPQPAMPPPPPVAPPRDTRTLEEKLGARWTVWVGGVALARGGLLLVRYSS